MSSPRSASPQQHDGAAGYGSAFASARSAASSSASGRGKTLADARVSEELEIALDLALERFLYSDDQGGVLVEVSCRRGAGPSLRAAALVCGCGVWSCRRPAAGGRKDEGL